jgi:Protein of unknown function, DUF481
MIIMAMLLTRGIAFSQLNESDTTRFQFRIGTSGAWQEGNVTIFTIRSRMELVSNGKKSLVFKSQSNNLYQEFGYKKADHDLYSRNFLYYRPSSVIYPFVMAFAQSNFRRQIDYRWFVGVGATYQVVQKSNTNVKISLAIVNEDTKFKNDIFNQSLYNGNSHIPVWRSTAYFSGLHYLLAKKMKVFYNSYWQAAFDQVANNRIQMDLGTEIAVWNGLYLQIEYIHNYEQVVAQKVKEIDKILTFGINYQIKK